MMILAGDKLYYFKDLKVESHGIPRGIQFPCSSAKYMPVLLSILTLPVFHPPSNPHPLEQDKKAKGFVHLMDAYDVVRVSRAETGFDYSFCIKCPLRTW